MQPRVTSSRGCRQTNSKNRLKSASPSLFCSTEPKLSLGPQKPELISEEETISGVVDGDYDAVHTQHDKPPPKIRTLPAPVSLPMCTHDTIQDLVVQDASSAPACRSGDSEDADINSLLVGDVKEALEGLDLKP